MSESLIEEANQLATELANEHPNDIKRAISYITHYERRYIQEAFFDFEQHFDVSVQSLNDSLEKINCDISKCSQLTPLLEKLTNFNTPYASDIQHVNLARLQAIRYIIDGQHNRAQDIVRLTSSTIASLAYFLRYTYDDNLIVYDDNIIEDAEDL